MEQFEIEGRHMAEEPVIGPELIYGSVRQEILDQKKCQFQLFGAALTLTAAVLAYAPSAKAGPVVYIAPVVMNVLALTIILDKATSVQRMVGYLQLMESEGSRYQWMWEYDLNLFREESPKPVGSESYRRHTYIRTVALMLLILSAGSSGLYGFGPEALALRQTPEFGPLREVYGAIHLLVLILNGWGWYISVRRWLQLVHGKFTSGAIRERWLLVIQANQRSRQQVTQSDRR